MKKKRRICVVTGTRAEYGLLRWIIDGIQNSSVLELQLVVTGMHLSPEFGLTIKQIEKDGYPINKKIEMLLSSDTDFAASFITFLARIEGPALKLYFFILYCLDKYLFPFANLFQFFSIHHNLN